MAEYIGREALLKAISKAGGSPLSEWNTVGIVSLVASQPAADVVPVVHGRWVKYRDTIKCTICGFGMFPIQHTFMDEVCTGWNCVPQYCPNCGAKMEGIERD